MLCGERTYVLLINVCGDTNTAKEFFMSMKMIVKMVNKRLFLGMLLIMLVFGMAAVEVGAQSNSGIEGIWDFGDGEIVKIEEDYYQVIYYSDDDDSMIRGSWPCTIKGNTLKVEGNKNDYKFSIKGNTLTLDKGGNLGIQTGTKINISSSPVGRWKYKGGVNYREVEKIELLKDGTGICDEISITWKSDGTRLIIRSSLIGLACDYIIYESKHGAKLFVFYDDGGSAMFAKR